jgi:hypothetical protein
MADQTRMADATPKTQDHFRNMFHKRPLDDAGLPPPKAAATGAASTGAAATGAARAAAAGAVAAPSTASRLAHQPLPPPKEERAKGAAAAAEEEEQQLDEDAIEDALFGDAMPEAKDISAEEARRNAQMVTSNRSLVKDQQPLPPGWVQRTSKKKSKGKVYYVNLRTVRPPARPHACALLTAPADHSVFCSQKKFQRERPVADHVAEQVEAAAAGPAAKKRKTKPKVQNVSDALVRLGVVMKKEEKFAKATTMFLQLLENNMTADNSSEFLAVVESTMQKRTWIHAQDKRVSYVKLVQAVLKQREMYDSEHQWKMDLYEFDVLKHGTLFTDDSYGFPSAVNAVQYDIETQLEALSKGAAGMTSPRPAIPGTPEAAKRKAWEVVIMAALSKTQAPSPRLATRSRCQRWPLMARTARGPGFAVQQR